jgi:SAM-dependent methyltransferase
MSYANPAGYERFMGRWSARLAPSFLRFVGVNDWQHVLDVGCGTGTLIRALICSGLKVQIVGVDPVAAYVSFAREAIREDRSKFCVGGATALPVRDGTFDAALSLLVLQEFADPQPAVQEMARVTRTGGIVATCIWDFQDGLPMLSLFWRAAETVAPEEVCRQRRGNISQQYATTDNLGDLWRRCGLRNVETAILEISMEFSSFADFWEPFLVGSTPTSAFATTLGSQVGDALTRELRAQIAGVHPNGSFVLPARAWAIKGNI